MSITIFPYLISRETQLSPLSGEELEMIELFQEKAVKLCSATRLQKTSPMSTITRDRESGQILSFESNVPSIEKIEVLAMRFRFFFADKEPTHAYKILGLLYRKATDQWAKNYVARLREWHKNFMGLSYTSGDLGHPVKNEDVINLWFNSEFFHQDREKREKLDGINEAISLEASLFQLNTALILCTSNIESIYRVIYRVNENHQFIYTPNHHFEMDA